MSKVYAPHQSIKFTACNGSIYKTYKESWFTRFHLESKLANSLFEPDYGIIVLQMVFCEDMEVIAEVMYRADFEKYFNETADENKEEE